MKFSETELGLTMITLDKYPDERGFFYELYNTTKYAENIKNFPMNWLQDSISRSKKGVIRGLHSQKPPFAQAKIISVIHGEIYDVAVNIDRNSENFGKHEVFYLNPNIQLFIPEWFAHGFQCLSNEAIIIYKCSSPYNKDSEIGFRYDSFNIKWRTENELILSKKDQNLPYCNSFC